MIKFVIIFLFIMVGTVVVLHEAFQPDENDEYLPTDFQATPWQAGIKAEPTTALQPTQPPSLSCSPRAFAPNQTDYSTTVTIVTISDGDTVIVDNGAGQHVAKLWGIDAPELSQSHGPQARDALIHLLPIGTNAQFFEVWWDTTTLETYGIFVSETGFVNLQLLGNGWAYHSPDSDAIGNQCIIEFEKEAQRRHYGVWEDTPSGAQRPWEYRSMHTPTPGPTMPPTPQGTREIPHPFTGTPTPYPASPAPDTTSEAPDKPEAIPSPIPGTTPVPTPTPDPSQPSDLNHNQTPSPTRNQHGTLG